MRKYKDWDLLQYLPEGWRIDETAGSPLCGLQVFYGELKLKKMQIKQTYFQPKSTPTV